MSQKYIKRIKKGKGRQRKQFSKKVEELVKPIRPILKFSLLNLLLEQIHKGDKEIE